MSTTPETRYWQHVASGAITSDPSWVVTYPDRYREVTVTPVDADPPVITLSARRSGKTQALIDAMLTQATARGLTVNVVYPTPSGTFAPTKPSDAEHLLSVVETIKETGGSVQIRGVLITPCDTYGQPLTNVPAPDADVAERIARAIEETPWDRPGQPVVAPEHQAVWMNGANEGIAFAARIARSHATPPAPSPEIPGFEGTRSALDGLTIRKDKTSD